jgi:hypothetical protein
MVLNPGSSSGTCDAFNGRMRDELINETIFYGLDPAPALADGVRPDRH